MVPLLLDDYQFNQHMKIAFCIYTVNNVTDVLITDCEDYTPVVSEELLCSIFTHVTVFP